MHQRVLSVAILLLALLMAAAGGVIAAAFCPSTGSSDLACHKTIRSTSDSKHNMHGEPVVEVDRQSVKPVASRNDHPSLSRPGLRRIEQMFDSCSHCISHSNLPQSRLALREAEKVRSSCDVEEPRANAGTTYLVLVPQAVNAREHAPPPDSSSLHVLLNVFRI